MKTFLITLRRPWGLNVKNRIYSIARYNARELQRNGRNNDEHLLPLRPLVPAKNYLTSYLKSSSRENIDIDVAPDFAARILCELEMIRKQESFERRMAVANETKGMLNDSQPLAIVEPEPIANEPAAEAVVPLEAEVDVESDGSVDIAQFRPLITNNNNALVSTDAFMNTLSAAYTTFHGPIRDMLIDNVIRDLNDKVLLTQAIQQQKIEQGNQQSATEVRDPIFARVPNSSFVTPNRHQNQQSSHSSNPTNILVAALKSAYDKIYSLFSTVGRSLFARQQESINSINSAAQALTADAQTRFAAVSNSTPVSTSVATTVSNPLNGVAARVSNEVERVTSIATAITIARVALQNVWGQSEIASRAIIHTIAGLVLLF